MSDGSSPNEILFQHTRRVPIDHIAVLQSRRRRLPSFRNPVFQKLIRGRMLIPDGDRRHGSKSGRVVNEKDIATGNDNVVGKLVLGYDLRHDLRMNFTFRLTRGPGEHVAEPFVAADLLCDKRELIAGQ